MATSCPKLGGGGRAATPRSGPALQGAVLSDPLDLGVNVKLKDAIYLESSRADILLKWTFLFAPL